MTTTLRHWGAAQATSLDSGWTQLELSQSAPPVSPPVMANNKNKLGIETEKGKEAVRLERKALDSFCTYHHHMDYVAPKKDEPAVIDAFFTVNKGKDLYAVVEVKSRDMTKKKLIGYDWEMMITHAKVKAGRMMGKMLCCPFVIILYLVPDEIMLVQQVSDKYGDLVVGMEVRKTMSQETINGGKILRENAFINMKAAKEYKV